ncbi:MAG: hypothetical protein ACK5RQ_09615 [Bacteroidota bacterium]|jgi:hypothetical protein
MSEKIVNFLTKRWRLVQILYLRFICLIVNLFNKKIEIKYAGIDFLLTSDVSTLIWIGKRCYKIELPDGQVFSGFTKVVPIKIKKNTTEIPIKFYGVGVIVEKRIAINRNNININLKKIIDTNLPKAVSISKGFNTITVTKLQLNKIQIPKASISIPKYINE